MGFVDKIALANVAAFGRCVAETFRDDDDEVFSSGVQFRSRSSAKRRRRSTGSSDANGNASSDSSGDGCCSNTAILWPTLAIRLTQRQHRCGYDRRINFGIAEFQLKGVIGSGGFGRAYLGETSQLSRLDCKRKVVSDRDANRRQRCRDDARHATSTAVVVKLLAQKTGNSAASNAASLRSEENAIGLDHPHVARTLATGWTTASASSADSASLWATSANSPARKWSAGAVDQLLNATTSDSPMAAVVMQFAGDVNLQNVIDDVTETMDFRRRVRYAHDIGSALAYIHSRFIVHLDVKPANIVVNRVDDRCKLIDFGCSMRLAPHPHSGSSTTSPGDEASSSTLLVTRLGRDDRTTTYRNPLKRLSALESAHPAGGCGTLHYRAPELLRNFGASAVSGLSASSFGRDSLAYKADVYSFGVTLWQLAERRAPYEDLFDSPLAVAYNVVKYSARPDGASTSPHRLPTKRDSTAVDEPRVTVGESDYRTMYAECWNNDPNRRPNADELTKVFDEWSRR